MNIFQLDPLQDSRWGNLVETNAKASVYHRKEWLDALKSAYDYEPMALSACSPTSSLTNAIVFCRVRSKLTGKRIVSLPFSDHCEPLVENKDEAESLITNIKDRVDRNHWKYVEIRPVSTALWDETIPAIYSTYYTHCLDLSGSEERLFKSFDKDCVQRRIRRAERESLRYEEGTSESHLERFYKLLVLTRRKHSVPPQPLRWFRSLISSFGKDLKILLALKGDTPIAGILSLSHRKTITYKYSCSDPSFKGLAGTPFLLWRMIMGARAKGYEELDLGRTDIDNGGLVAFKDNWGARRSVLSYRRYPLGSIASEERKWTRWIVKRLISAAPDSSLVKLGNLFYRHVG